MSDATINLRADLDTIATNWHTLLDLPRSGQGQRVDTSLSDQTPITLGVLSMRVDAAYQLAAWVQLIWRQRDLREPVDLTDMAAVCNFLHTHAGWLVDHPAGQEACDEIGSIATNITGLIKQTRAARFRVGLCPECGEKLVAIMPNSSAHLPAKLQCDGLIKHGWTYAQWSILGVRINPASEASILRLTDAVRT